MQSNACKFAYPSQKGENPKQNKSEMTKISEKVKYNLMANQLFLW